jgi:hypothetical protein
MPSCVGLSVRFSPCLLSKRKEDRIIDNQIRYLIEKVELVNVR